MPAHGNYHELRPNELEAIMREAPVAYVPWGALEWHGPHLPLGLDGITAETFAQRCVERTGGVLLPTTWWPITALPHRHSLSIDSGVVRSLWDQILAGLAKAGWRVIVMISGHYAQGHEIVLMDAAEDAMARYNVLVLALPPLAMVDEAMLDHAALWETSQLLALRPELVDLSALGTGRLRPAATAVLGQDPRGASASLGERALAVGVERVATGVAELLAQRDPAPLRALYERRRALYQPYLDKYVDGSLEDGIRKWWREYTSEKD
jgi:creatinine amidohydrolase